MKLDEMIMLARDEESSYELIKNLRLVYYSFSCEKCGTNMRLEKSVMRHGINARWRCSKSTCRSSYGLFKDSIFFNIHFPLSKALRCIYYYALNMLQLEIAAQLLLNEKTVSSFINNLIHNIDNENYVCDLLLLGVSSNDVFGVDETHIVTRRDERGRILPANEIGLQV